MNYSWRFNKEVVGEFDEHVRQSVPLYEVFHASILDLAKYYITPNSDIIDVGTSTGHFINSIYEDKLDRNNKYVGVDIEPDMITECRERYKDKDISFILSDAIEVDYKNASVITLILLLQFMKKPERIKLLQHIHDSVKIGTALFIVEKIKTPNLDIHDMYVDVYYDFKRSQGLSDTEILDKNTSLRGVMFPETLPEILRILDFIGFDTEVNVKYNNFASIIAVKR